MGCETRVGQAGIGSIAVGIVAAFISAPFVVNAMIRFVAVHSRRVLAWYCIALGLLIGVGTVTSAG
jgi:undecaprenyl-diphosphatase